MVQQEVIKSSSLLKEDGTNRFCVACRKLSKDTVKESYPITRRAGDQGYALAGAQHFSNLESLAATGMWK